MMGERRVEQAALFYEFSLDRHVPADHMLRSIDRFMDLEDLRAKLAAFYSPIGPPSIDPQLLIRMLLVGYCFGIRSERRLCEEVHLNLAYRWFCRLGLDGDVPDHSTFSKNRHGRFRESDLRHRLESRYVRLDTTQSKDHQAALALDVATPEARRTILGLADGTIQKDLGDARIRAMLDHRPQAPQFFNDES